MATARMRHHNSPEELAKRSGEPEPLARKGKEFRHYNHPEEVAKRAASGQGGSVAVSRRVINTTGEPPGWPPPGTEDNTAIVSASWPSEPEVSNSNEDTEPPPARGNLEQRLRRVENLLWTFLDGPDEAREFRRLLNNQQAVSDSQQDIINRVRTLEQTIEAVAEQEAGGVDDEGDEQQLPPNDSRLPDAEPESPPTVPDNPNAGGST